MQVKGITGSVAEKVNESFFDNLDCANKAWVLGFLYADGCVYKNRVSIQLAEKDLEILQNIKDIIEFEGKIYNLKDNIYPKVALMFTSNIVTSKLKEIGCILKLGY